MTVVARARIDCGSLIPSAAAVLLLMSNSNVAGCSTGMSPGGTSETSSTVRCGAPGIIGDIMTVTHQSARFHEPAGRADGWQLLFHGKLGNQLPVLYEKRVLCDEDSSDVSARHGRNLPAIS